jgi:hypothetical protein
MLRGLAFGVFLLLGLAGTGRAATITAVQTGPTSWVYNLTFAPLDNYSVFQPVTTITFNGLSGVTAAFGPTSTDFPSGFADTTNLAWTSQVLNAGTTVVWSHTGGGTGNWGVDMHVFGFTITALGAMDGMVAFATSGMSRDTSNPLPGGLFNLDISGFIAGPTAIPEPGTLSLLTGGLILLGWRARRHKLPG